MRISIGLFLFLTLVHPAAAQLHFPQPAVDWGEMQRGPIRSQRFAYVNNTAQTITITGVKSSCGCLTPKVAQRVVEPGQGGHVDVEVNTLAQPAGPNTWKTTVTCQSGEKVVEVILYIEANLKAELALEPAGLNFITSKPASHVVTLVDYRPRPLQIMAVRTSERGLKAQVLSSKRDEQGRLVHAIQVQVDEDFPGGRHEEVVALYTNDPAYRELRVPVSVKKEVQQQVTPLPDRLVIPVQSGQGTPSKITLIRDAEGRPVKIDKVIAEHPAVRCRWASGAGGSVTLRVEIDATQVGTKSFQTEVKVHLVSPIHEVIHIPVECPVTPGL